MLRRHGASQKVTGSTNADEVMVDAVKVDTSGDERPDTLMHEQAAAALQAVFRGNQTRNQMEIMGKGVDLHHAVAHHDMPQTLARQTLDFGSPAYAEAANFFKSKLTPSDVRAHAALAHAPARAFRLAPPRACRSRARFVSRPMHVLPR